MTVMETERIVEFPALKEAREALTAKRDELAAILREAGPEYDMSRVKSIPGDTHAKVEHIRKLNLEIDEAKARVDELLVVARAAAEAREAEQKGGVEPGDGARGGVGEPTGRARKSIGRLFVESDAFKGYRPGGGSPAVTLDVDLKDLFSTGSWEPETTRTGRVELFPTRPAPQVVTHIPQTTTSQASVVYMEETTFTNAAAETAEGGAYPEAALELTEKSMPTRKLAVFLPVTDETFEDEPRAEAYVNNRLPYMLQQRLDSQVLVGTGTGVNLLGTANVAGIQTQAQGSDPLTDAIYKLFRKIREDGFAEPSVVFVRPSVWEQVRLMRTTDGVYIWGPPSAQGPMTIWGVPVVETVAAPADKVVAGDYANFAELAVRRGVDVQVSNSHADFFASGKLAIRADVRVAMIHYRPRAFGVVTLASGDGGDV